MIHSLPYCLNVLRATDRDRYISVLFAPKEKRRALAALYAFNAEITRVRESVHDPFIGELRLRWWYDAIANGEMHNSTSNPILNDLFTAITSFNLPKTALLHYCDAQILDIYHNPIATIDDLKSYFVKTASIILQLSCQILDSNAAQNFTDACKHGGIAQGLSGVLRLVSFMRPRYQYYFPIDMLKALGVDREELEFNRVNREKKRCIIEAMVALSRDHYIKFYNHSIALPKTVRTAFLPLVIMPASLEKAIELGEKVFQENATLPLLYRYWLITKAAMTKNFPKCYKEKREYL
ncbi:phytoene/squalene synthase family protein [Bartonella sp. CB189]|uniref:phytoene/squalene synthase family protein n=1 Tax=Bartonella sp. CB189 TaxID=3112254 RepID=UPI002F969298